MFKVNSARTAAAADGKRNFMGRGLVAAVVLLWLTTAAPALSFQFMLSLRRALGVLPLAQRESIGGFRQHFRILCCVHTH